MYLVKGIPPPISGFTQNEVQVESTSLSGGFWGNQEVFVGDTLEISCSGSGSAVTVKWSKAGAYRLEENVQQRGNVLRWGEFYNVKR